MKRLVYNGKAFEFRDAPDPARYEEAKPRRPQKAAFGHRGMPYRLRDFQPLSSDGNGYRPGPLVELGPDQCRWTLRDGLMCGARCKYPYCEDHARQAHGGR